MSRESWPKFFMRHAELAATRSSCLRRQVGAVAVRDKRILATGFNGSPSSLEHCEIVGCLRERLNVPSGQRHELCRAIHAEQNLIVQAAKMGISLDGCDIYCTHQPCFICFKMLINIPVRNIYFLNAYPDELTMDMAEEAHVMLYQL